MKPYEDFLRQKAQVDQYAGFEPVFMPSCLFDFQAAMTDWSVRMGRAALFEDCGLGKTVQELVWADNVVRKTNGNVMFNTPLAVGIQVAREAEKFGIEVHVSRDGQVRRGINIVNYERLHLFSPNDFVGHVGDESSILKNYAGTRRAQITNFTRKLKYRLLASATAAPNDYIELGTSSEALGYLGHMDMLNRFFKNDLGNSSTGRGFMGKQNAWRFKGHAEIPFWRWVCSWARALRKPSDLGFSDEGFVLPPLEEVEHLVETNILSEGMLFALPAADIHEKRDEQHRTVRERCEKVADLVNHTGQPALIWCQLNEEGDLLEKLIPDAVQVSGKQSDDAKEDRLTAFAENKARVMITKHKIGAWGLNLQHCNHIVTFPTDSYEQHYQGIRRCWRFGQKRRVRVDIVTTEGGQRTMANLRQKSAAADRMFSNLVNEMNASMRIERSSAFTRNMEIPKWLSTVSA
ncbi:MAG: helicase [Candidimonas sp.]|nr:MAG: helicase [Candidimonas sp.]TAM24795.1 MAG: helicase [Candidimonas sp.]